MSNKMIIKYLKSSSLNLNWYNLYATKVINITDIGNQVIQVQFRSSKGDNIRKINLSIVNFKIYKSNYIKQKVNNIFNNE